ncbi:MAG: UspA protein [Bacillota bacterium]|jgi:nucleotide-binding universal stress UspA family protein|nr:UspA protein [Bacillota bacterium]
MKLLVPVDGSSASIDAVKKSIEIARKHNYSIKLINVVNFSSLSHLNRNERLWRYMDGSTITESDELSKITKENAEKLLNVIIDKLDFTDIKTEKEVLSGEPYEKILEVAKNENFDLIVMGNRGFSKIKRFFVGSVTQKVISEAPCPVLVIHSDDNH